MFCRCFVLFVLSRTASRPITLLLHLKLPAVISTCNWSKVHFSPTWQNFSPLLYPGIHHQNVKYLLCYSSVPF